MHLIIGQLSNDANMAGVDAMCSGYDTSELSEVSFVFIHQDIHSSTKHSIFSKLSIVL